MTNPIDKIELLQDFILLKKISANEAIQKRAESAGITLPGTINDSARSAKGIVLRVGEGCERVKKFQKIAFYMYATTELAIDDDEFLIVKESDVLAILDTIKKSKEDKK